MESLRQEHVPEEILTESANENPEVTYSDLLAGRPPDPAQLQTLIMQNMLNSQKQQ